MSRFNILDRPVYGGDIVNNVPEGPVFDLGVDLEMFVGPVYLRTEHVAEMAAMLGMVPVTHLRAMEDAVKRLKAEIETLKDAKEFLDNVRNLVRSTDSSALVLGGNLSGRTSVEKPAAVKGNGPDIKSDIF